MLTIQIILTFYTLFGCFLGLLLAVLQITAGKRGTANKLRFAHFLCNAFVLLGCGLIPNEIPSKYPLSVFLFFTCCLALGPLYFFSINSLTGKAIKLNKVFFLHFLPATFMLLAEIVFQIQDVELKKIFITGFLMDPIHSPFALVFIFIALHMTIYIILLVKDMLPFWSNDEIYREARTIIVRLIMAIVAVVTFSFGVFLKNSLIMLIGGCIFSTEMISILITQDYYPSFFFAIKKEMRRKRYEHSLLQGLNTKLIEKRLADLMKDEQLYMDMDLNLRSLAERLSISPHQLSQFLNEHLKSNFRTYINDYRVKAAELLLKENRKMSITTICYEVGFKSKAVFYSSFKDRLGLAPQEYRNIIAASLDKSAH